MNKTILITGATGVIGSQLVQHFLDKNYNVVATSRNKDNIINKFGQHNNLIPIEIDFFIKDSVKNLLEQLKINNIEINYLINTARSLDVFNFTEEGLLSHADFLKELELEIIIPYELSLLLAKYHPLEKIVNIASMYGVTTFNHNLYKESYVPVLSYSSAKAGVIQLTKGLAVYLAPKNIMVNCISYGGIEGRVDANFKEKYAKLCPMQRMMKKEETIGAIEFLLSDNAQYITGHNLVVDGGWTIW